MYMVRLVYVSRLAKACDPDCIGDIMAESEEHNKNAHITGLLCYDSRFFLQCLEGPRDKVNEVYRHIMVDKRNTNVTLLDYSDIHEREFAHWAMAFVRVEDIDQEVILKFNAGPTFDPYLMSAEQAIGLLKALH